MQSTSIDDRARESKCAEWMERRVAVRGRFTLIELLVVVAIIGVLASMLLPSLSAARERARTAACLNQIKQQGTAVLLYAQDHNDWLIPYYSNNASWYGNQGSYWDRRGPALLEGYLGDYQHVLKCPSDRSRVAVPLDRDWQAFSAIGMSYAYRPWSTASSSLRTTQTPGWGCVYHLSRPPERYTTWGAEPYSYICDAFNNWGTLGKSHPAGYNVWFVDGHAALAKDASGIIPTDMPTILGRSYVYQFGAWRFFETEVYPGD